MGTWEGRGLHAGAVWYSHYQPAGEGQPSLPLGHCGCLHTSRLPVDTRPPPPEPKVSTWEQGCAGASKTDRQQVPSETLESPSGVGVGGCRFPSWEAQGKGRPCVPGTGSGVQGGLHGPLAPGTLSQPAGILPSPGPRGWCVTLGTAREAR